MLAAAVDARKRLFVKQADEAVFGGDLLHNLHHNLILVGGNVGGGKNGRKLVLSRSNLVMFGFGVNAEFPKLCVKFRHKRPYARFYRAEVVVAQFLTFRRFRAEKSTARENYIFAFFAGRFVDKKIFLLGADGGVHAFDVGFPEQFQYAERLNV